MNRPTSIVNAPYPFPRESAASWIQRTCQAHDVSYKSLAGALGMKPCKDPDLAVPRDHVCRIGIGTGVSGTRLAALADAFHAVRLQPGLSRLLSFNERGLPTYRFCPKCIAADLTPYLRIEWRLKGWTVCPDHRLRMAECCPHCGAEVQGAAPSHSNIGDKALGIGFCSACRESLVSPETEDQAQVPIKPRKIKTQQATASALRSGFFNIEGIDMRFPLEFMLWLEDNQAWVDELRSHREATANRRQDTYVALRLRDAYYSELDWTEPLLDAPLGLGLWLRNNSARVDRLREYSRIEWKKRQPTEFMEHLLTAYNTERLSKQPFSVLFQRQMLRDKKRKTTWAEKCWEASLQRQAKYRATAAGPHEPSQCSQKGDPSSSEQ